MANEEHDAEVNAVTIAANGQTPVCMVDAPGVVTRVTYIPRAAVVGAASPNSRTLTLYNTGQAGAGSVVCATLPMIDAGSSLTAFAGNNIPLDTVAHRTVATGDILRWDSVAVTGAGGLVDPGGTVEVEITPALR